MDDTLAALVALSARKNLVLRWNGACYVPCKGDEAPPRGYTLDVSLDAEELGWIEAVDCLSYRITDKGRAYVDEALKRGELK